MIHTLLGKDGFRRGMDLYIAPPRQPGRDDRGFRRGDAGGRRGRSRPVSSRGTRRPARRRSRSRTATIAASRSYELNVAQKVPPTPGQPDKSPMLIPLAIGLLGAGRRRIADPARRRERERAGHAGAASPSGARELPLCRFRRRRRAVTAARVFGAGQIEGRAARPAQIPGGARYRAVRALGGRAAGRHPRAARPGRGTAPRWRADAARSPISSRRCSRPSPTPTRDPAFAAEALALPSEAFLADRMTVVDVDAIHAAREVARAEIGRALAAEFAAAYRASADPGPYLIDGMSIGRRALRNAASPISPPPIRTRARHSPRRSSTPPRT